MLFGALAVAFWSAFMFFMASVALVRPHYLTPEVQRTADLERVGFLALIGVLYVVGLIWSAWGATKVWKGEM